MEPKKAVFQIKNLLAKERSRQNSKDKLEKPEKSTENLQKVLTRVDSREEDKAGGEESKGAGIKHYLNKTSCLKVRRIERKNVAKLKKAGEKGMGDDKIYETFSVIEKKKSLNDINFIIGCLKSHFVFYNLSEAELY